MLDKNKEIAYTSTRIHGELALWYGIDENGCYEWGFHMPKDADEQLYIDENELLNNSHWFHYMKTFDWW